RAIDYTMKEEVTSYQTLDSLRGGSVSVLTLLKYWLLLSLLSFVPSLASPGEIVCIPIDSGDFEIEQKPDGTEVIHMEGFRTGGGPGTPLLPRRVFDVALPPDVDRTTVVVRAEYIHNRPIDGMHELAPAPPAKSQDTNGNSIIMWGDRADIRNGKAVGIYQDDADYPESFLVNLGISQMRKWVFARVEFTPVIYNPVTGALTQIAAAQMVIEYERSGLPEDNSLLSDTAMDDVACSRFSNFDQAINWYQPPEEANSASSTVSYVIITTSDILSSSNRLTDFVQHKRSQGFSVIVATEDDYDNLPGQAPNGRADKIRRWLKDKYIRYCILYVLLIGDPSPETGDVPMKICWPVHTETAQSRVPTDYYFADLSGNWDLDGDTFYGENGDDGGPDGIDLVPDVYVGRIPIYEDDYYNLDRILQKTIDYQTAKGNLTWRKKFLLPLAFCDVETDSAYLGESMADDYLTAEGFSSFKLYQQGGCIDDSIFESNLELVDGATSEHWRSNSYGLVTWMGHGSSTGAYIGYGDNGCGTLFSAADCRVLDETRPAIVCQCSCLNASPEENGNLSYSLLKSGAIAAIGASSVEFYAVGWSSPTGWLTAQDLAYEMNKNIAQAGYPVGKALADAKSTLNCSGSGWLTNAFCFNIYGDPQVHCDQKFDNRAPLLAFGTVEPSFGTTSTIFNFSVECTDDDGDVPITCAVVIDGEQHEMSLLSGSRPHGKFILSTRLSAGVHRYFFYFCDAHGGASRYPPLGDQTGPSVDYEAALSQGNIAPTAGTIDTGFTYFVTYYCSESDLPVTATVVIDDQIHSMSPLSGLPGNGEYRFEAHLRPGDHSYHFKFQDSLGRISRLPDSGGYSGPSVFPSDATFVHISTDKQSYSIVGDSISISLDMALPEYAIVADFYVLILDPGGLIWSPAAFGTDIPWLGGVWPIASGISPPSEFEFSCVAHVVNLPTVAPFNSRGQFLLFTALVNPGTIVPLSQIGEASFRLE
ncbi:MAG: hypothetical protein JW941_04345, partial [Candidatus Coatesbacteria bacterium]|nr:hypothetical protein [Candidatus Coatesbacteria bacterium]